MPFDVAAYLAGAASTLWGGTTDTFDLANGTFGSVVAVTGDAHQAQVAQDIFRQEVRIERSLRVREDIRDAHQLMIENVQTQLLMGNIVLGICFTVLIEGRPSDSQRTPVLVQELWAVFALWAISLSFLSVWFALQYQEQVSVSSRKRLLEKHRITTPNDEVVGRMGGLSLAEKVAELHQRGLNEITDFLESRTGCEGAREYLCQRIRELADTLPPAPCSGGAMQLPTDRRQHRSNTGNTELESLTARVPPPQGPDMRYQDSIAPALEVELGTDGRWPSPHDLNLTRRQRDFGEFRTVRALRGTRAWFGEEDGGTLLDHYIVDLPDFLLEETLVRLPWSMPDKPQRRSIRLMVRGTATLYVAAQWPPLDSAEAFRGQGPPPSWTDEEMPRLRGGIVQFQRVEGFSILVSDKKMDLPVYRAALEDPGSSGWTSVKLSFQFGGPFLAPVIILRRGSILTTEEDWPVNEFMNELDEIQPLRDHSMSYMSQGLLNLLLAAFCAHLGRILTDRPWPMCKREVVFVLIALCPAVFIALSADTIMRTIFDAEIEKHPRLSKHHKKRNSLTGGGSQEAGCTSSGNNPSNPVVNFDRQWSVASSALRPAPEAARAQPRAAGHSVTFAGCCLAEKGQPAAPAGAGVGLGDDREDLEVGGPHPRAASAPAGSCPSPGFGFLAQCRPQTNEIDVEEISIGRSSESNPSLGARDARWSDSNPVLDDDSDVGEEAVGEEALSPSSPEQLEERRTSFVSEVSPSPDVTPDDSTKGRRRLNGCCCDALRRRVWETFGTKASAAWREATRISLFFYGVRSLWAITIFTVIADRTLSLPGGGRGSGVQASEAAVAAACGALGAPWAMSEVAWPSPFFMPSAAAMAPGGRGELWLASDWLLAPLPAAAAAGGGARSTLGGLARLPEAATGLFVTPDGSRLLIAGEEAIHAVDLGNLSASVTSAAAGGGSAAAVADSAAVPTLTGAALALPRAQLGKVTAVAGGVLPLGVGSATVFALAPEAGGIYLSSSVNLTAAADLNALNASAPAAALEVALRVPRRPGAAAVRALHLCTSEAEGCGDAGESALWAADAAGCLTATGLASGKVLGSWRWAAAEAGQHAPVALAGNASHLHLVAPCETGQRQSVFSAPYSGLLAVGGGAEGGACGL